MEIDGTIPRQPGDESTDAIDEYIGETDQGSGWTSTKQAAKSLGVSRRMVQEYVRRGILVAIAEGEGVNKRYYVSIDSLNDLRERRSSKVKGASDSEKASWSMENPRKPDEGFGEVFRSTIERLEARTAEAADLRARLELTTQAESSLREALERERERANQAEEDLRELRWRLDALSEPPQADEKVAEGTGKGDAPPEPQEPPKHRSWLYRFFFGP